jgi:hypothetical protein
MDVRILSMMVVGPKQTAKAKMPKEAAVPFTAPLKQTRSMDVKMLTPQKTTGSM